MIHVAIVFEFPTLNGGEHSMLSVLKILSMSSEFRFTAIAPSRGLLAARLAELNIPVLPFSIRDTDGGRRDNTVIIPELLNLVRQSSPVIDVLHANSLSMSRLVGQLDGLASGQRRSGHIRDIMKLSRKVTHDLNGNNALVAVSNATRDFHVQRGLDKDVCQVIHNGVDSTLFSPGERSAERRLLFPGVPDDAIIVLNVGQICLRKGQLDLARVIAGIECDRQIHLVLVGERHSGKTESVNYEHAIPKAFTEDSRHRLQLCGHRTDVNRLMKAADLLAHTARQEPFGRVLLEAASSGLPILATDTGGTSELLTDQRHAMLVPPNDASALEAGLRTLIGQPELRARLSDAARSRIEREFTSEMAAIRLSKFWKNLSESPNTA